MSPLCSNSLPRMLPSRAASFIRTARAHAGRLPRAPHRPARNGTRRGAALPSKPADGARRLRRRSRAGVGDGPTRRAYFASTGGSPGGLCALVLPRIDGRFCAPLLALRRLHREQALCSPRSNPSLSAPRGWRRPRIVAAGLRRCGRVAGRSRPLCDAMQIAAWSHLAYVDDIVEDAAKSIVTPAVALGETYAPLLSYALLTAACFASSGAWLDACSLTAFSLVDARRRRRRD